MKSIRIAAVTLGVLLFASVGMAVPSGNTNIDCSGKLNADRFAKTSASKSKGGSSQDNSPAKTRSSTRAI